MNQQNNKFNQNNQNNNFNNNQKRRPNIAGLKTGKSRAIHASRRSQEDANRLVESYNVNDPNYVKQSNLSALGHEKLRVVFLGGMRAIGTHNLVVFEYENDAIVVDCGFDLSVDLPGVNYGISDISYLDSIKHKVRGYIFSHGHLDHIGAVPYVLPRIPAKVYGSQFTCGMIAKQFDEDFFHLDKPFMPDCVAMNMDGHEKQILGCFTIELVRVTHSIPDCSMVVIDTPVGRIIHTGDFRLDPEPLDKMPTDIARLRELANDSKGIMALMCEATNASMNGRVLTESTLQESFHDIMSHSTGRIFISSFSSNVNRVQLVINSAHQYGRKVAIAGRSMLSHIELAVKLGHIRIPADTVVAVKDIVNMPDNKVVVLCTGGQGETNSALQRMSTGQHPQFKLKFGDTVVQSSTPIPGNEVSYDKLADDLTNLGVKIFSAKFFEVDGCGPLHVSGHAKRDEHRELIDLLKPKYLIPMYAGPRNRKYLAELGMDSGIRGSNILMLDDGEAIEFDNEATLRKVGQARVGTVLIDETGMMVPGLVVKDRLVMQQDGIVMIMLTLNRRGGRLLTSPDIITRGFIYIKQNEDLMQGLRNGLRELARLRFGKGSIDDFKQEIKDFTTHFLYEHTQRSPIVIPVLNVLGGGNGNGDNKNRAGNNNTNAGEKMPQIKPKAEHDINHN